MLKKSLLGHPKLTCAVSWWGWPACYCVHARLILQLLWINAHLSLMLCSLPYPGARSLITLFDFSVRIWRAGQGLENMHQNYNHCCDEGNVNRHLSSSFPPGRRQPARHEIHQCFYNKTFVNIGLLYVVRKLRFSAFEVSWFYSISEQKNNKWTNHLDSDQTEHRMRLVVVTLHCWSIPRLVIFPPSRGI